MSTPFFRLLAIALIISTTVVAQDDDYANDEYVDDTHLRYEDYTYKDNIKTVMLRVKGAELSNPVLQLQSQEQFQLQFDDLDGGYKTYNYTFVHCDANWEPSNLVQSEYMRGFFEQDIINYEYSFNTIEDYTHYRVSFPNENISFKKSGNYILKVYEDYNKDDVVLTRRFMIYDQKIDIRSRVHRATILDERQYKHEVDFTIFHRGYEISNPFGDIKVVVRQNNRWDNAITDLKPLFIKDEELVYDYEEGNTFWGGNEFRVLDMKSLRFQSEQIKAIRYDSAGNHVWMLPDAVRNFETYNFRRDINGDFVIRIQEGRDHQIEADYAHVHFSLLQREPVVSGNLYLFGAMSEWQYKPEFMLKYNYNTQRYEGDVYLKQGYYNYEYMLLPDGKSTGNVRFIEGSFHDTEQNYFIYVYHRAMGTNYDQLIGVHHANSQRQ